MMQKQWQAHSMYLMLPVEQQVCCHDASMLDLAGWCRWATGGRDPAAAAAAAVAVLGELQEIQRDSEDGYSRAVEVQKTLPLTETKDARLSQGYSSCLCGICPSGRIPAYSCDPRGAQGVGAPSSAPNYESQHQGVLLALSSPGLR